jgi:hypothetical protein
MFLVLNFLFLLVLNPHEMQLNFSSQNIILLMLNSHKMHDLIICHAKIAIKFFIDNFYKGCKFCE